MEKPSTPHVDLIIRHGSIIDGTGAPKVSGDIAIRADRIVAMGDLGDMRATREVDASGHIVAPGFIDAHTHDDLALLATPDMTPKVSQGVTSLIAGNCGVSLAPLAIEGRPPAPLDLLGPDAGWFRFPRFRDFVDALDVAPPALNCALLVGHITLRHRTMDRFDRPATRSEIAAMRQFVEESMDQGAIGFSTGLDYPPAVAASREEVRELVASVKPFGGIYCSHTRNYFESVEEALDEALEIGEHMGVPVVISHHQVSGAMNFGKSRRTLKRIDEARRTHAVGLDAYPYNASSKTLDPGRAKPGVRIMVTWSLAHPNHVGRELADIAREWGCSETEAAERLLPAGAIYFQLDEEDVRRILAYPHTMIGSDGLPLDVHPHPRLWGSFPRVLGHYSRDVGLMPLVEAVRRMTSLPAAWFGLRDRGVLRPGAYADIVIFDPETVADRGTFIKPAQPAAGIASVFVNGDLVWTQGAHTGARPGKVLKRDPSVAIMRAEQAVSTHLE